MNISLNVTDIAIRAAKTFAQAFVTFVLASGFDVHQIVHVSDVEKLLLAAAVAATSVVWNTVVVPLLKLSSTK